MLDWGLTLSGIDDATSLFIRRLEDRTVDELIDCVKRILDYVQQDDESKKKLLLIQIAAAAFMDGNFTEEKQRMFDSFAGLLDFRPSEARIFLERGFDLQIALRNFAKNATLV